MTHDLPLFYANCTLRDSVFWFTAKSRYLLDVMQRSWHTGASGVVPDISSLSGAVPQPEYSVQRDRPAS